MGLGNSMLQVGMRYTGDTAFWLSIYKQKHDWQELISYPSRALRSPLFLIGPVFLIITCIYLFVLIVKSPKRCLESYCFCSISSYYYYYYCYYSPFFLCDMNVSTADLMNYWREFHETWWSYRYIFLVGPNFSALW